MQLLGREITGVDLAKAEAMIEANYGVDYPKEKFELLWELVREEGWTDVRLRETVKHFLKTQRYATWTIADFFGYEIKLHGYTDYLKALHERGEAINDEIEWFMVNGKKYFGYIHEVAGLRKLIEAEQT